MATLCTCEVHRAHGWKATTTSFSFYGSKHSGVRILFSNSKKFSRIGCRGGGAFTELCSLVFTLLNENLVCCGRRVPKIVENQKLPFVANVWMPLRYSAVFRVAVAFQDWLSCEKFFLLGSCAWKPSCATSSRSPAVPASFVFYKAVLVALQNRTCTVVSHAAAIAHLFELVDALRVVGKVRAFLKCSSVALIGCSLWRRPRSGLHVNVIGNAQRRIFRNWATSEWECFNMKQGIGVDHSK